MKDYELYRIKHCRICKGENLYSFLDLGTMPTPNAFIQKNELKKREIYYPLEACVCESCYLVQLSHVIPSDIMFKNYLYIPSTSVTMLSHFKSIAEESIKKYRLTGKDLVVDIGSNDGTLLGYFKEFGINTLGVDPASNLVHVARLKGIETVNDFFTKKIAKRIVKQKGKAKIITATNVIAHINDLDSLFQSIKLLLKKDGVFIMDVGYGVDLVKQNQFDSIYHEHLSYFTLSPLLILFRNHKMKIIDIKRTSIHGGSVVISLAKLHSRYPEADNIKDYLYEEAQMKMDKKDTYDAFAKKVVLIKQELASALKKLRQSGKRVVGYGASARGNVLLNYCNITRNLLEYIVDSTPFKQGCYTPGTHIPIHPESFLVKDNPDYALLLSWNFVDEILNKQTVYRKKGGKFIIALPHLQTV